MTTELAVALISAASLVTVALVGVMVELIKSRKRQDKVVNEVTPNGGSSLRDAISRIEQDGIKTREAQGRHGERLAAIEARLTDHLMMRGDR